MYFAKKKKKVILRLLIRSPWLHISFKTGSQLYCEYIPDVRTVKGRFFAFVDFVEIIEIMRSLSFIVHFRHLGGRNGTNSVSLSGSDGE